MITGVGGDELFGNYSNVVTFKQAFPQITSFDAAAYTLTMYGGAPKAAKHQN
jgi:asparagine synthetase B (glutamine-hydrolysing)